MKILFLHLCDSHIKNKEDGFNIKEDKIIDALNELTPFDQCIIVYSGDISSNGEINEYKFAGGMIGSIIRKLSEKLIPNKHVQVIIVPGNHDLNLSKNNRNRQNIIDAYKDGTIEDVVLKDIRSLEAFYTLASRNKCFIDNRIISHVDIIINGYRIHFTLINTAPLSLKGSTNDDMGLHYLSEVNINNLIPNKKADINIAVMHHSTEWFNPGVKEKLRQKLAAHYNVIFEGHEHIAFGENRSLDGGHITPYIQGNSLSGDRIHKKGFTTLLYDTATRHSIGHSFIWENDYYKNDKIIFDDILPTKENYDFTLNEKFEDKIYHDDNSKLISAYYVFPSLTYSLTNKDNQLEIHNIKDIDELVKTTFSSQKTIISGESRSGKSLLSKQLLAEIYKNHKEIIPILLQAEDLENKKIDKIVKYAFEDQYKSDVSICEKYLQLGREKRILLIDDASRIQKHQLEKIILYYQHMFAHIVIFCDKFIELNIHQQVVDSLTEEPTIHITIKPFLYQKRRQLIGKAFGINTLEEPKGKKHPIIDELNNIISTQVRFFRLDPEFILEFVYQFKDDKRVGVLPNGTMFSMVYETSIKNKLISNTASGDINAYFNLLSEMAYIMHFSCKSKLSIQEVAVIIEAYNKEYRQRVRFDTFATTCINARILIEKDSIFLKFKDNNMRAYFTAQHLNRMSYYNESYDDIRGKIEYLLKNICYSINSDIIMFMAFITSNTNIINVILNCAAIHFTNTEEFDFEHNCISFLKRAELQVKETLPTKEEKEQRDIKISAHEEELKADELIDLVNEYDYSEEDLNSLENQIIKSVKYIEILSKILPAFGDKMKVAQQDELVKAIYKYPNRFLQMWLKEIDDKYEVLIKTMFEEISLIRKERNIAEINIKSLQKTLEQLVVYAVVSLYQATASTSSTKHTIAALDAFEYTQNSNYKIMNLMMMERVASPEDFASRVRQVSKGTDIKLVKDITRYIIRNYLLNHDTPIVGEGQFLLDSFMGPKDNPEKKNFKMELAKNKYVRNKDHTQGILS